MIKVIVTKASLTHAMKKLKYFKGFFSSSFPFWFAMENYCPYTTWSNQNCFTCQKVKGVSKIKVQNRPNSQKERSNCWKHVKGLSLDLESNEHAIKQGPTRHTPMAHPVGLRYISYFTTLAEHAVHRLLRPCWDGFVLACSVRWSVSHPPTGWPHDHGRLTSGPW